MSTIFNIPIKFADPFWHLHSLNEIFIEEVYKFNADTSKPFIIDCGANVGLSVLYFKKLYPGAKVIAFEPDKAIFKMLLQNLESLNITDVITINKAVWIDDSQIQFLASGALGGKIYTATQDQHPPATQNIESIRLKSFLTSAIDFLKIDIEGAELAVVKDCKDVLHFVKHLFVEYHSDPLQPQSLNELLGIIKGAGFRVYMKEAWNNRLTLFFLNNIILTTICN